MRSIIPCIKLLILAMFHKSLVRNFQELQPMHRPISVTDSTLPSYPPPPGDHTLPSLVLQRVHPVLARLKVHLHTVQSEDQVSAIVFEGCRKRGDVASKIHLKSVNIAKDCIFLSNFNSPAQFNDASEALPLHTLTLDRDYYIFPPAFPLLTPRIATIHAVSRRSRRV